MLINEPHFDFGCLTLLVQDEAPGLQVRQPAGAWVDILPREGQVVVNCGRLIELWTSGRIVACEHRVLSQNREQFSIPFFYKPRLDCEIAPLADAGWFEHSCTAPTFGRHCRGCGGYSAKGRVGERV